jgi:hypothetical protein
MNKITKTKQTTQAGIRSRKNNGTFIGDDKSTPDVNEAWVSEDVTSTLIPQLQPNPFQHEILALASKQRSNAKKVEVLREYRNDALITLFIWNFDESVVSVLPEGPVPYADLDGQTSLGGNLSELIESKTKSEGKKTSGYYGTEDFVDEKNRTSIRKEYQNFYIFVRGGNNQLSQIRKETMFINILQGLHPLEAEIMCLVKDKKLTDKYKISFQNVKDAYTDIVWGGRS